MSSALYGFRQGSSQHTGRRNALRRATRKQGKPAKVISQELEIDLLYRRVRARGHEEHLSPRCYEVLRALAECPGRVIAHEELLSAARGAHRVSRQYLHVTIRELRCKLEVDPTYPVHILTEPHIGYRLATLGPCDASSGAMT